MTGCLYISPDREPLDPSQGVVPVMFADTLATFRNLATGEPVEGPKQIPTLATTEGRGLQPSVSIARKLHIVGPVMVAYAGQANFIASCHADLKSNLPEWLNGPLRPMRRLGDQANLYNRIYGRGKTLIECMGVCIDPNTGHFNTMAYRGLGSLGLLGPTSAIGSGFQDLLERARLAEPQLADLGTIPTAELIRGLAGTINGRRLCEEILFDGNVSNGWGGYVEYVAFNPYQNAWMRGPRSLNLFYFLDLNEDRGKRLISQVARAIAYDPGDETGHLLSIWRDAEGRDHSHEFPLGEPIPRSDPWTLWENWRPDTVTISFMLPRAGLPTRVVSRTTNFFEMEEVIFEFSRHSAPSYGLREEFLIELAKASAAHLGDDVADDEIAQAVHPTRPPESGQKRASQTGGKWR